MNIKLAVLASGRGSNFLALIKTIQQNTLKAEINTLLSDREKAHALDIARTHNIPARYIPYDKNNRQTFEEQAVKQIKKQGCDLVILAGFMRLLTPYFIREFAHRILNIHPSLLPSFKGIHAQKQALDYGVKISGCTVHVVTEDMDSGPIIGQRAVHILEEDTEETLSARILEQEHALYPEAIQRYMKRIRKSVYSEQYCLPR
ncbi:MAG: phosphoribosylglycinamide formyltransferase [Kiritimatiellae bacterium]|nr:phosphoribosylglycinamide formyltransferase [Kiritimatiellia bacterium]